MLHVRLSADSSQHRLALAFLVPDLFDSEFIIAVDEHGYRSADKDDMRPDGFSEKDERRREECQEDERREAYLEPDEEKKPYGHLDQERAEDYEERIEREIIRQMVFHDRIDRELSVDELGIERRIHERSAETDAHDEMLALLDLHKNFLERSGKNGLV